MLEVKIFTLYPDLFPGPLDIGIFKKARENKIWNLKVINIREYSKDNHGTVDDTPFGGGSGMLLRPDILASAIDRNIKKGEKIIYLSPRGKKFDQNVARSLSKEKNLNLICGHFEGVDQRLLETRNIEEYSLGDFVLSGGEPASFVLVDALLRLLPGVLNDETSALSDSFQDNLIAPPVYTRPSNFNGWEVPKVLTSGNLKEIEKWRFEKSLENTKKRRPDLLK